MYASFALLENDTNTLTVESAITATLYNGHLLNAASGHPFVVLNDPKLSIMAITFFTFLYVYYRTSCE